MENDKNSEIFDFMQKIKRYLITNLGKVESVASNEEFYFALCMALREKIMINWTATEHSHNELGAKTLYYLCMEYLPGKFLTNNITNLKQNDLVLEVTKRMGRNLKDIISCDAEPGLGNGGLGRLASCFLDSLATLSYPAWAYGLRYQYGIFEQELWNGVQVERPDCWLLNQNPWEFRKDNHSQNVKFAGTMHPGTNIHGDEVFYLEDYEEVRALPFDTPIIGYPKNHDFNIVTLRLWSTKESPRNFELQRFNAGQINEAGENTAITDVLYPNDNNEIGKKIRLKQEFLLVCASIQDILHQHLRVYGQIDNLDQKVQIQINDTHPALVIAELMRRLIKNHNISWKKAFEMTQNICNYTNHTIMKEALEEWNESRLQTLLPRQYKIIQKINQEFCDKIRITFPNDPGRIDRMSIIHNGQIKMAHLAILGSKKVNGVAELHTEILKNDLFKDFVDMYPQKFIPITNGVTQRRWLFQSNPCLCDLITKKIGDKWKLDFHEIQNIKAHAEDSQTIEEFLKIKQENKKKLFNFIKQENPIRDYKGKVIDHYPVFEDYDVLVESQIKRYHEYKRQLMNVLHALMLYNDLKQDPLSRKVKRMIILAGKAAPGYDLAKKIMLFAFLVAKKINTDKDVNEKLKFVVIENYNVSKAELIIPASDLSVQISTAGYEASGTGNMKLSMNGSLTIGTEDGANIEMRKAVTDEYWPFKFGLTKNEINEIVKNKSYNPNQVYLENEKVKNALDMLKNDSLVNSEYEHQALLQIYTILLEYGENSDKYFVLKDLVSYYETQKKVEDLYIDRHIWTKFAIHNIGGMGRFSSDEVINNYAKSVWELDPCPLEPQILEKVRNEYLQSSACYVGEKSDTNK
ncbi:MAG: Glycogen phosphorylase [Candidatus Anoxychlamydiales bacterium]|nr:Glycogen phosphorylase [Candidatus Anoxychlamydiales bacterium]